MPITRAEAREFVALHHRHNDPPPASVFQVGLADDNGDLVGVAIAGRPVSAPLAEAGWLEITRVATLGERNANSMLYGACARAAKALGWSRLITYTLPTESGSSLRAAGWVENGETERGHAGAWNRPSVSMLREQPRLFDTAHKSRPLGPKLRWVKYL